MMKNILILALLVIVFILIPKNIIKSQPKTNEKFKLSIETPKSQLKIEIPQPKYIRFYDVQVGESFRYNGRIFVKTSNEYYYRDYTFFSPTYIPPNPALNANWKFGSSHFDADTMVMTVIVN